MPSSECRHCNKTMIKCALCGVAFYRQIDNRDWYCIAIASRVASNIHLCGPCATAIDNQKYRRT